MMECEVGETVKVARSTPKLEAAWQKLKELKQLGEDFGIGSEVMIESKEGDEATVSYGDGRLTLPAWCLSCHDVKTDSVNVWDGMNRDLELAEPETGPEAQIPAASVASPALGLTERECTTCGAAVTDVDTICSVCGSTLPVLDVDLEEPAPAPEPVEPAAAGKVCPSCGAEVDAGTAECPICETPFDIIEKVEAPVAAPQPVEQAPEPVMQAEPVTASEPEPPKEEPPAPEPAAEIICGECGASLEEGSDECFICGAKIGEPAKPAEPEPVPADDDIPRPAEPEPAKTASELICAGCGAELDDGTDECFICGAKMGELAPPAEPEPIPADDDVSRPAEPVVEPIEPEPAPEAPAEVTLGEGEILCPSCNSVITDDNDKCPECWTDLSLYVKCQSCGRYTPAGEPSCRECYAAIEVPVIADAAEEPVIDDLFTEVGPELDIPEDVEIPEELKGEMAALEAEEEHGKECLVCGAVFGSNDDYCPICGMEFGVEIDEPEHPQLTWAGMEVEVQPLIHTCPNCGNNVTGLEATDREVSEGKWFYRGLVAIFTGIFFTSFSIYARGVSVENESLGMHPPPTDVLINILGWILVLVGFVFWYLSWRLHDQRTECPSCGIETEPGMTVCVNCGGTLGDDLEAYEDSPIEDTAPEEQVLEEDLPAEETAEAFTDEELGIPPETPVQPEPAIQEPAPVEPEQPPKEHFVGEELPVEHEEHKKCPGCGIFVDMNETICPICDTVIDGPALAPEPDVPSEDEELASLDAPAATGPKECPSCGAEVEAGTKACPVCEYPLEN